LQRACADFFDALLDVHRLLEAIAQIDLVLSNNDHQSADEAIVATLFFTKRWHWRNDLATSGNLRNRRDTAATFRASDLTESTKSGAYVAEPCGRPNTGPHQSVRSRMPNPRRAHFTRSYQSFILPPIGSQPISQLDNRLHATHRQSSASHHAVFAK